jgi:hypothetical protein
MAGAKSLLLRVVWVMLLLPFPQLLRAADADITGFWGGHSNGTSIEDEKLDGGSLWGFRFGVTVLRHLGTEFSYTHLSGIEDRLQTFQGTAHEISFNLLLEVPIKKLIPFATAGVGVLGGTDREDISIQTGLDYNLGGGIKFRQLAGPLGFRFDARYHKAGNGIRVGYGDSTPFVGQEFDFKFTEVSVAVMLTF